MLHTRSIISGPGVFWRGPGQKIPCRDRSFFRRFHPGALAVLMLLVTTSIATAGTSTNLDLTEVPLEQLMNLPVTILKGNATLSKTPAAVSVVTQDDIHRSGAINIPETLRLVP